MVRERLRHGIPGRPLLPLVLLPLLDIALFPSSALAFDREDTVTGIALLVTGLLVIPTWVANCLL